MSTKNFFLGDLLRTLFPLSTNRILVEHFTKALDDYVYQKVLNDKEKHSFLPQQRVYGSKPRHHLRRTVKLDPVAEYFIYDFAYRNRRSFRRPHVESRAHFGYRFAKGEPIPGTSAYGAFRKAIASCKDQFGSWISFDVASYFNSIYHHDLVNWFRPLSNEHEASALGQFLREANGGRSIDCLPQGLYPCKMLGSSFLSFVENSNRVRASQTLRFMDDFYLFDDDPAVLLGDFQTVQELLGAKALSINPSKTCLPDESVRDVAREIDQLKVTLLKKRRELMAKYDTAEPDDLAGHPDLVLDEEQRQYLLSLLAQESLAEEDADLVLALMREHTEDVLEHLELLVGRFPNLAKRVYVFCRDVEDKQSVADILAEFIGRGSTLTEYQLFWLGKMVGDYLLGTSAAGDLIFSIYENDAATAITKAKMLELPDNRFGMPDLRESHLKTGQSDWLAWASAIGSRKQDKAQRNSLLKYFSNGSPINRLIGECVNKL